MIELLERKVISTGRKGKAFYFLLPAKWVWLQKIGKGDTIHIVLTTNSLTVFNNKNEAEAFANRLEKIEKKEDD